jgi:cellulose synthase/poly-beta-1,6-N-acetylglucosamine synthase-like glycosyltransferase
MTMIEHILFWILTVLCASYTVLHAFLWSGLNRLSYPKYSETVQRISVIIAARNEGPRISALLDSILQLEYPADCFEIILVNDRSDDTTGSIARSYQQRLANLRVIDILENTSDMPNKKNALRTAIALAQYDILAFTDADCTVPPQWLTHISEAFSPETGVVAGYSPYRSGEAGSFLRYEELKNSVIAAAAVGAGVPFLCTGRNVAYRKEVYQQVGGFDKIKHSISGDDDLFLQLVHRETRWTIRYMTAPQSGVATMAPSSLSQFVHQRTRHVSASSHYPLSVQCGYGVVHLFHLSLFVGMFLLPLTSVIALTVKFNVDGALAARGMKLFEEQISAAEFFINELLLVLYSFAVAPLGFIRTFSWKGASSR